MINIQESDIMLLLAVASPIMWKLSLLKRFLLFGYKYLRVLVRTLIKSKLDKFNVYSLIC